MELPGELFASQWFLFTDKNGRGRCEIDYYIVLEEFVILIECKLTRTKLAELQMKHLYKPILQHVYKKPVVCLQICKNIKSAIGARAVDNIRELIEKPMPGFLVWHYIGN